MTGKDNMNKGLEKMLWHLGKVIEFGWSGLLPMSFHKRDINETAPHRSRVGNPASSPLFKCLIIGGVR